MLPNPTHSFQFIEWDNLVITTLQHTICAPIFLKKITKKPNNYQFYLPYFLRFNGNISNKLLIPSKSQEKCLETMV